VKRELSPLDPCCARRICNHSTCPALDDLPCSDFVSSPEMSGEDFKRACEIEEQMLLLGDPNFEHHASSRGYIESKSGLSSRRATLAFERLVKYRFVARVKNYCSGHSWITTEKGQERIATLRSAESGKAREVDG